MLRADLIDLLCGVPGWLSDEEAWTLHEAARTHRPGRPSITIVELGSWQGRSTIALAAGLRARGAGILFAVDPHRDSELHRATGVVDTYAAFAANLRSAGVAEFVTPLRALSTEARGGFAGGSVDLLFIDGSHLYEDVVADLETWSDALADVAVIAFHDARDEPGVRRALAEHVIPPDSSFHQLRPVDNLLVAEFRRATHAGESVRGPSVGDLST